MVAEKPESIDKDSQGTLEVEMEVAIDCPAVIVAVGCQNSTPRGAKWIDCQFKLFEELPAGALKNQKKQYKKRQSN